MRIDRETARKVAVLARLHLPEDQEERMAEDMSSILDWIEQLGEIDVGDTEALSSVVDASLPLREDVLTTDETGGGRAGEVVANAPKTEDNFFVVPKVVE